MIAEWPQDCYVVRGYRMKRYWTLTAITVACLASPRLVQATTITLGTAVNYGVLGLVGSETISNNNVTVKGNEGISNGGAIVNTSPSTINGNVYESTSGQYSGSGTLNGTLEPPSSGTLAQNDTDVNTALSEISGLTHTQTFGSITSSQTINGNGGLNVIDISGDINLGNASLTLHGTSSDYFVVHSTGGVNLSGLAGTGLLVSGGVTASHVIYDFTGTSGSVTACATGYQICTTTANAIYGTLLAPNLAFQLGNTVNGEVIGAQAIFLQSGGSIVETSFTGYNAPEPSSILLLGTGLSALAGFLRKRRTRSIVS